MAEGAQVLDAVPAVTPQILGTFARRPAEDASDREGRREQFGRQAQAVQQQCSVELDIGVEPPLRLAFTEQTKRGAFDAPRQVVKAPIAAACIELLGGVGQDIRARIAHSVDAMSESHEALAPIQLGADDGFRALGRADFEHHVERRTGRAAMQWALERAHGAGDRRDDIGSRDTITRAANVEALRP